MMSSSYANQTRKKGPGGNEPWRSKDRHYCAICNAWMGSDKQSIALHENGKKHREAVEADLVRRRDEKARKEKEQKELESVFAKVNAAVGVSVGSNGLRTTTTTTTTSNRPRGGYFPPPQQGASLRPPSIKKEASHADNVASTSAVPSEVLHIKPGFDPNVGHYNLEGTTYLEGQVYAHIFEEGMPIQLWMGSILASDAEKCDLRNTSQWKMALLAKVVRRRRVNRDDEEAGKEENDCDTYNNNNNNNSGVSCHVSYLQRPNDDEETLETNVTPSRIRLILGSDPSIPYTLEEAHLSLIGGKQIIKLTNADTAPPNIDENTGLSGWTTTEICKVSSQYEMNQDKKRKREHEKEVADYQAKKVREVQARKMEEAKYDNAHDSALGAYDVWSSADDIAVENKTRTYKGVDITRQPVEVSSVVAKILSKGMGNVPFKKMVIRKKKNGRTTSADDD